MFPLLSHLKTRTQALYWAAILTVPVAVLSILLSYGLHILANSDMGQTGFLASGLVPALISPPIIYHLLNLIRKLELTREALEATSREDYLTGIFNRRYVEETAAQEFSLSKRHNFSVSILLLDLDHFKKINDTYGHAIGDFALVELTKCIKRIIRKTDTFGRFGGEEFILFMPHTTLDQATLLAERILHEIAEQTFDISATNLKLTASIGVATIAPEIKTLDDLILHADNALYRAKSNGRNRVEIYTHA